MSIYLSHYVAMEQRKKTFEAQDLKAVSELFKYEFGGMVMDGNAELLNFVFENAQMGITTIRQLIDLNEDSDFEKQLSSQLSEYESICTEAKDMLNQNGYEEKGLNSLEKIRTYLMINMQTITDKSPSHIAEMLMIGSNMGVVDAIKNLRKYNKADKSIIKLMEKLQKTEEKNMEDLKQYL